MELSGLVTRPAGSDSYPPAVGTRVAWSAVRPIRDLYAQGKRYGIPCLGILGNDAHLRLHGDHTPWSAGKERGLVWAGDWDLPDEFLPWMVAYCRSAVDTSWIDFWNFRNHLYDHAGNLIRANPDHHFHLSTDKKAAVVTLFDDYARDTGLSEADDVNLSDSNPIGDLAAAYKAAGSTPKDADTVGRLLNLGPLRGLEAAKAARDEGARTRQQMADLMVAAGQDIDTLGTELAKARTEIAALADQVAKLQTGGVDQAALADLLAERLAARLANG